MLHEDSRVRTQEGTLNKKVSYQDFVSFGLTDTLDVEQLLLGCVGHCLNGVEPCFLQLLDVTGTDSTLLHPHTWEQDSRASVRSQHGGKTANYRPGGRGPRVHYACAGFVVFTPGSFLFSS